MFKYNVHQVFPLLNLKFRVHVCHVHADQMLLEMKENERKRKEHACTLRSRPFRGGVVTTYPKTHPGKIKRKSKIFKVYCACEEILSN